MKYFLCLMTLPLTVLAVSLAASNATEVRLSIWPLPQTFEAPLSFFLLAALGFGFFFGALFVWMQGYKTRWLLWKSQRAEAALRQARQSSVHSQNFS